MVTRIVFGNNIKIQYAIVTQDYTMLYYIPLGGIRTRLTRALLVSHIGGHKEIRLILILIRGQQGLPVGHLESWC